MTNCKCIAGNGQDKIQIQVLEGQLSWFVHIISAILKGRLSATSTAENQAHPSCDLAKVTFSSRFEPNAIYRESAFMLFRKPEKNDLGSLCSE